jgi:hypothetical protein
MLYCAASKSYLVYGDTRHNEESDIEDRIWGDALENQDRLMSLAFDLDIYCELV